MDFCCILNYYIEIVENCLILCFIFVVEAPADQDVFYVDGRPIPDADALWWLMYEALEHRRVVANMGGNTNWYYQVGTLISILGPNLKLENKAFEGLWG